MSSELKPCPFCGSDAALDGDFPTGIGCSNSECAYIVTYDTDGWNRRATSPAVKALVEACRNVAGSAFWRDGAELPSVTAMREALAAVEREIGGQQ